MRKKPLNNEYTEFKAKYGSIVAYFGFTQIPNILIENQKNLKLKNSDFITLINFMRHDYGNLESHISGLTISKNTGMNPSTIYYKNSKNKSREPGIKERLLSKNFIKIRGIDKKYNTDIISLLPLIKKLRMVAKSITEDQIIKNELPKEKINELLKLISIDDLENSLFSHN